MQDSHTESGHNLAILFPFAKFVISISNPVERQNFLYVKIQTNILHSNESAHI